MKSRPVRICDISRIIRISSSSLISFLQERGFRVIGDFRSPLSSRMLETIQTGFQEGPPFTELNPYFSKADLWENEHAELVDKLHTPEKTTTKKDQKTKTAVKRKYRKSSKSKVTIRPIAAPLMQSGKINLSFIDLELIHRILELPAQEKLEVRNFLRRKLILKTIANLE